MNSGQLKRLFEEDGIRGITSKPAIFEKAITSGTGYDQDVRELAGEKEGIAKFNKPNDKLLEATIPRSVP